MEAPGLAPFLPGNARSISQGVALAPDLEEGSPPRVRQGGWQSKGPGWSRCQGGGVASHFLRAQRL